MRQILPLSALIVFAGGCSDSSPGGLTNCDELGERYGTGSTFYVDGQRGSDDNPGTSDRPFQTIERAGERANSGDTVVVADGIYEQDRVTFGPDGAGPDSKVYYRAAEGARVIFTRSDGFPPAVTIHNYVRIEGLWFGGEWDKVNDHVFAPGGGPIGKGKEIVGCTIFGYKSGIVIGSSEDLLVQGNRLVHNGTDLHYHGIYLSGGYDEGSMSNHVIVDSNIFVAGEGYGIHGWHNIHSTIVTRNVVIRHFWGFVADGSDHLVANNFIWKMTGQPQGYGPGGAWLAGSRIVFMNNILGPDSHVWGELEAEGTVVTHNAFLGPDPVGEEAVTLEPGNEIMYIGITGEDLDQAVDDLDAAFSQPVSDIYLDDTIEPAFARVRILIPATSPLTGAGTSWFDLGTPMNIGPDAEGFGCSQAFWDAFRMHGLRDFNNFGTSTESRLGTP